MPKPEERLTRMIYSNRGGEYVMLEEQKLESVALEMKAMKA